MKYCPSCGKELNDTDRFCPSCGHDTGLAPAPSMSHHSSYSSQTYTLIGFIFLLIGTVTLGLFIIPLCWCIPFTVHVYRKYKRNEKPGLAIAIASLLLVSLIGGIFLIIASSED